MNREKIVAVTGANGMVGCYVVAELLRCGYSSVLAVVRSEKGREQLFRGLEKLQADPSKVVVVMGELFDYNFCLKVAKSCDIIVNCAARVAFSPKDGASIIEDNVTICSNIVSAAEQCNISKFIHISSIATLSDAPYPQLTTEKNLFSAAKVKSAYSVSKFYCENEVIRAMHSSLCGVILLPAVILGEWSERGGSADILPSLAKCSPLYCEGVTGYVMVGDVARAVAVAIELNRGDGERFILCSENLSFKELTIRLSQHNRCLRPKFRVANRVLSLLKGVVSLLERVGFTPKLSSSLIGNLMDRRKYDGSNFSNKFEFTYEPILHQSKR